MKRQDDDDETPYERIVNDTAYRERLIAQGDIAFEEGKVTYLLKAFKMNVRVVTQTLRQQTRERTGQPRLLLRAFNETFSSFPLLLGATRLDGVKLHTATTATLPALFKNFGSAPFVDAYESFYEQMEGRAQGRAVGLIFPRKGLKNGLIIYTVDDPLRIPLCHREGYFMYAGGSKKDRHYAVVRSFQKVVEALHNGGHGWRPD